MWYPIVHYEIRKSVYVYRYTLLWCFLYKTFRLEEITYRKYYKEKEQLTDSVDYFGTSQCSYSVLFLNLVYRDVSF